MSLMMNIFCKYVDTIPPFKKYGDQLLKKKQIVVVVSDSEAKVLVQFVKLRSECLIQVTSLMMLQMSALFNLVTNDRSKSALWGTTISCKNMAILG